MDGVKTGTKVGASWLVRIIGPLLASSKYCATVVTQK